MPTLPLASMIKAVAVALVWAPVEVEIKRRGTLARESAPMARRACGEDVEMPTLAN